MSGSPSRHRGGGRGRLPAVALLAAGIAGGGVLASLGARSGPATALQPAGLAAEAAPAGSVSSSWYCPGAPAEDAGTTHLVLANAAGRAVRVGVVVVDERGERRRKDLRLEPHAEADVVPGQLVHGAWLASRVEVAGGAVSAAELVDGRSGRAVVSCASEAAAHWYFASGSTSGGSTLGVSLFNPTSNLAVVDLSFVTESGFTAPAPFQGLVIAPGRLRTFTVGAYVQNKSTVATEVTARSGAVVAGELQLYGPGGRAGISLSLGAPTTSTRWDLPTVQDQSGGASQLDVFNPSPRSEHVVIGVRLATGPIEPFSEVLGPQSVWTLVTSDQLRIVTGQSYTMSVRTTGAGVVVARAGSGGRLGPTPWWAEDVSVSGLATSDTRAWLVAGLPGSPPAVTASSTARAGAVPVSAPQDLAVENPGRHPVRVEVTTWAASGSRVRHLSVPAGGSVTVSGLDGGPIVARADGPIAVIGDASPVGTVGMVGIPSVPLRSPA